MARRVVRVYAKTADVMRALRDVATEKEWVIKYFNETEGRAELHSGHSFSTHEGQKIVVNVSASEDGSVMEVQTSILRAWLGIIQVFDWGEGSRIARKVVADTLSRLGLPEVRQ